MNNAPIHVKKPLRDAVKATLPYALATSVALNAAFGVVLYKFGSALESTGAPDKRAEAVVGEYPVIQRSTELETCKITITKYQAAQQQGGRIYWGSKIDSCGPATPESP